MTSFVYQSHDASYHAVAPRRVRVIGDIGPFVGMTGTAEAEDDQLVWVRFTKGGSYAPCDKPGVYGLRRDQLVNV